MTPDEIKAARERLGLTREGFGTALGGYTERTVQSWELGEREISLGAEKLIKMHLTLAATK